MLVVVMVVVGRYSGRYSICSGGVHDSGGVGCVGGNYGGCSAGGDQWIVTAALGRSDCS